MSEDPIGLAGGINPYTYAGNDPVNLVDRTGLYICTITGFGSTDEATFDDAVQEATNECFQRWLAGAEGQFFIQRPGYYAGGGRIPQWAIRNVYAELGGVTRASLIGWVGPTDCESAFGGFMVGLVDDVAFVLTGGAKAAWASLTGLGRAARGVAGRFRRTPKFDLGHSDHRGLQRARAAGQRAWDNTKDEIKTLHLSPGTYVASSLSDFVPFVNTVRDGFRTRSECF